MVGRAAPGESDAASLPGQGQAAGSALQNLEGDDPQAARRRLNAAGPPPLKIVSTYD